MTTRIDVIRAALAATSGGRYLEIGVNDARCFDAIDAATKVAVDPRFAFRPPLGARIRTVLRSRTGVLYFPTTSDAFFGGAARRLAPFDVVFVDGLHTYEQAHRDVFNTLAVLAPGGVVVVHDCNPANATAAAPTLEQAERTPGYAGDWNGEVYRAIVRLRTRDDLRVSVLDLDQGVGIVTRGTPDVRLDLSLDEVERVGYADIERDRARLLDLRRCEDLPGLLAARGS